MIQVDRLTKSYGPVTAVHDVSFNVEKGQIVGFLGPNGAGKSTTMKILACFMAASGGSARVAGFDVFSQSLEVRRRIGYLPENSPLYTDLPVAAYLDFVAEAKGVSRGTRRSKVADVMDRCFITDMQHRLIGKLSKGYRQRVGLAQALLGDPEVLILDEPTIGLDPRQIAEIRALIKSLGGQHTVILSTHILPEVSMVCDSIIIINRGRVVAKGTQAELVEQVFPAARVEVEVAGPAEAIVSSLKALPGVTSVEAVGVATAPPGSSSSRRAGATCAGSSCGSWRAAAGSSSSCTRSGSLSRRSSSASWRARSTRRRSWRRWWRRRGEGLAAGLQEGDAPLLRVARRVCRRDVLPLRRRLLLRAVVHPVRGRLDALGHAAADGTEPQRHGEHPAPARRTTWRWSCSSSSRC